MNKKNTQNIVLLAMGILLVVSGFLIIHFVNRDIKTISGVMIGIGAGLAGMSIAKILTCNYFSKNPAKAELEQIELADERNIIIRDRAKAKAGQVTRYALIIAAFFCILMDVPLWIVYVFIGIYLSDYLLSFLFIQQLQKEM